MWCLFSLLARASDADSLEPALPPLTLQDLPLQVQEEERWTQVHLDATRTARTAGWISLVAGGMVGAGAITLFIADESGDDTLYPTGGVLVGMGAVGVLAGPPVLLSASLRANRALRERGVYVSSTPAITGWTLYGLTVVATPLFVVAWPLAPVYYGAIVASGFGQIETNRVGRRNARLEVSFVPTRNGFALAGRF